MREIWDSELEHKQGMVQVTEQPLNPRTRRAVLRPPPTQSWKTGGYQEPTEPSKQLIRARYLGHVTGYQPTANQGPVFYGSVGS